MTNAGSAHLSGIHTLGMSDCMLVTDAGLLAHITSVHTLWIDGCTEASRSSSTSASST